MHVCWCRPVCTLWSVLARYFIFWCDNGWVVKESFWLAAELFNNWVWLISFWLAVIVIQVFCTYLHTLICTSTWSYEAISMQFGTLLFSVYTLNVAIYRETVYCMLYTCIDLVLIELGLFYRNCFETDFRYWQLIIITIRNLY